MSIMIAEFSQSRNDLHWSIYTSEDGFIRWGGYDDANWWDNVSNTDHAMNRVGPKSGRVYRIEFDTRVVTILTPEEAND